MLSDFVQPFVSDAEVIAVMGAEPPTDQEQAEAYFDIALRKLTNRYGVAWSFVATQMGIGCPPALWEHFDSPRQRKRERAALEEAMEAAHG